MAHQQQPRNSNEYETVDEFGNPIQRTGVDPAVHHSKTTGYGTYDTNGNQGRVTGTTEFAATTAAGQGAHLQRSGSSGSSSSEDDGCGGRRKKKGLKDKIKEKLPSGHKDEQSQYGATTTTGVYGEQHQEKGMMDKIKEKLPGHH